MGFEDSKKTNLLSEELISVIFSGKIGRKGEFLSFFKICFSEFSGSKFPPKFTPKVVGDAEKLGESGARFGKIPDGEARARFLSACKLLVEIGESRFFELEYFSIRSELEHEVNFFEVPE